MRLVRALLIMVLAVTPSMAQVGPPATCTHFASNAGSGTTCTEGSPCTWATGLSASTGPVTAGETLCLRGGTYTFSGSTTSTLAGTSGSRIVVRSYPGEWAKIEDTTHITDLLIINGQDTDYRDFELFNSNATRSYTGTAAVRGAGIRNFGLRTRLINLVIHDTGDAIFMNDAGIGSTVSGPILYNNGYVDSDRGHGKGVYAQNESGTLTLEELIIFNNYDNGLQGYGQSGSLIGVTVEGVISGNNGSPSVFSGNPAGYSASRRAKNILLGTTTVPIDQVSLINSYAYHPTTTVANGGSLYLGESANGNTNTTVTGNYVVGDIALKAIKFTSLTFTGNFIYAGSLAQMTVFGTPSITWNNNTYHGSGTSSDFKYGASFYNFANWKTASGFDAASTHTSSAPTGTTVVVRPNAYETGRAHIVIFNWNLSSTVSVNLSTTGLTNGQGYEVRDGQNFLASPVLTGTYNSGSPSVSIPMTGLTASTPIGSPGGFTPTHTAPQFGAFVVLPTAAPPASPPTAPSGLTANAVSASQIDLGWTDNSSDETGFKLERCAGSACSNFVEFTTTAAGVVTYSNTGLTTSTLYRYRVRATNSAGDSAYTSIAEATTAGGPTVCKWSTIPPCVTP